MAPPWFFRCAFLIWRSISLKTLQMNSLQACVPSAQVVHESSHDFVSASLWPEAALENAFLTRFPGFSDMTFAEELPFSGLIPTAPAPPGLPPASSGTAIKRQSGSVGQSWLSLVRNPFLFQKSRELTFKGFCHPSVTYHFLFFKHHKVAKSSPPDRR